MNKTIVTGKLTSNAEVKEINEKTTVINFTIANNDADYKDANGEWVNRPAFFDCQYFVRKESVNAINYAMNHLKKAAGVLVEGVININCYNNQEGKAVGRLTLNVSNYDVVQKVQEQQPQQQQ